MAVTPSDVAVELGRPTPLDPATAQQWQKWIDRAYRMVQRRAEKLGVDYATLDQDTLADVITYAIVRRISRPVDGAESTTDQIGVDVGNWQQTRRYSRGEGDIFFLDSWWADLGLGGPGDVYSLQMTGAPDQPLPEGPWWP